MNFFKNVSAADVFMLLLCAAIIIVAEYLFLTGNQMHALFIGLWAPTLLGIMNFIKQIGNGRK